MRKSLTKIGKEPETSGKSLNMNFVFGIYLSFSLLYSQIFIEHGSAFYYYK